MTHYKKTVERRFLNAVLSAIGKDSPSAVMDDEEPDFIVRFGAECVGVEVIGLYHPPTSRGSARAWEGTCEAVLKAAQRLWETKGLPRVHVSVSFNTNIHFPKDRWAEVGEKLVACVHQVLPSVGRQAVVGHGAPPWLAVNVDRPTEVDHMIISRDALLPCTLWTPSFGGAAPLLTGEIVQEAINRKRRSLAKYRKKAPTIWLIVGMEFTRFSDYFTIRDPSVLDTLDTSTPSR